MRACWRGMSYLPWNLSILDSQHPETCCSKSCLSSGFIPLLDTSAHKGVLSWGWLAAGSDLVCRERRTGEQRVCTLRPLGDKNCPCHYTDSVLQLLALFHGLPSAVPCFSLLATEMTNTFVLSSSPSSFL